MFNALMNIAGVVVPVAITLSEKSHHKKASTATTAVEIGVGLGTSDAGGHAPAISLWNVDGDRLGQHVPGKDDNIEPGDSWSIDISHPKGHSGQPEYAQLTAYGDDAICITYVGVTGSGVQWIWTGDVGYTCGGDWYPSTAKNSDNNYQPKCAWIDANHSNGLHYIAMSMHMPDFSGDKGMRAETNHDPATMCNSKARFMLWGQVPTNPGQNFIPPMFHPPLKYNGDGSDKNKKLLYKPGTVPRYEKYMRKASKKASKKHQHKRDVGSVRPDHVIISDYSAHNATEVCESDTSRGPSFVSTAEGVYCDMSTKTAHPLCSAAVSRDKAVDCFDVDSRTLVDGEQKRVHPRDVGGQATSKAKKQYNSSTRWTPQ